MLGRKTFTQDEIEAAERAVGRQLAACRDADPVVFESLVLALDRRFVHRLRAVAGKDGNALNEVELVTDAVINHDGVMQKSSVIRLTPEESVLGLRPGDRVRLGADDFERLSGAFLTELRRRFL